MAQAEGEGFGELLPYTLAGFAGGLGLGALLDGLGFQRHAVLGAAVRTLAGDGESLFEGAFALKRRLAGAPGSMAEAYGWGKLAGMSSGWVVDAASRLSGLDVYGVEGFHIPFFYALGDQIGGNLSGLLFLRRREGSWRAGLKAYGRDAVMMASLSIILLVPLALLASRRLGFSPDTQVRAALETGAANLCWVPPLIGALRERRRARP